MHAMLQPITRVCPAGEHGRSLGASLPAMAGGHQ
jgi:hypothetical protein